MSEFGCPDHRLPAAATRLNPSMSDRLLRSRTNHRSAKQSTQSISAQIMALSRPNFTDLYCAHYGVNSLDFSAHLCARCLHRPHCWIGRWLIRLNRPAFDLDLELARYCGTLDGKRKLEVELQEFTTDYRNRRLWRRYLRCRISTHRLRRVFKETFRQSGVTPSHPLKTAE